MPFNRLLVAGTDLQLSGSVKRGPAHNAPISLSIRQHGWGLLSAWCPPKEPGFPAIPMRVNAGDSIPISRKEREAPRDCGCKERGKGGGSIGAKKFL